MSQNSNSAAPIHGTVEKYGRFYGLWRYEKYLLPIDAEELDRLDMSHKFFTVARNYALYSPRLTDQRPLRVLDLGTGTGIWAISFAEAHRHQPEIQAVDLHLIQPARIPRGMTTIQFDIEDENWDVLMTNCDIVYLRALYGSIHPSSWPSIYRNIFNHLLPRSGYVEHVEIDWVARWEGNDIPRQSAVNEWSDLLLRSLERFDRDARIDSAAIRRTIEGAGFVDFEEVTIPCYMTPWMENEQAQDTARWFNVSFCQGLVAMSLRPMIEGLGKEDRFVHDLCRRVHEEVCQLRHHVYFTM
ncbi:methyltransferase LaeA [Metarhizium album ARSEF 1941]|uniref:Methyltransferase LaeA n=1 Tax=Metarhizium album (strain ARSEF 1941) TaxID=1081103 RepID=A0A0B2WT10_METAS|nr:methyltransferase LaeA [Metarhizium album ARSEF 1941]KHN96734.1 methyltransferase LaeA [Metarhizium album ARSEF 1941]